MKVSYKYKDAWGNIVKCTHESVANYSDEKSEYDSYILRVIRDKEGNVIAGPMIGQFFDFTESPD